MKRFMMAMSAALMLTACGEHEGEVGVRIEQPETPKEKTVTFTFGEGDRAATRATLQELNITDLWLFDYVGDVLQQTVHQTDGFGALTLSMDYGEHRLCFVASRGSEPTVTPPAVSWDRPSDTFWAAVTMNVQPTTATSQTVTLRRVATRLYITIDDAITADMARLEVEPVTWYYGLNVRTGEGVDARRQVRQVNVPASYVGTDRRLSATFFGLSPTGDWQTDVTVRLIGSDDSLLGSVTLPSARFSQNLTAVYSGGIVGASRSVTITADDAWDEDDVHTW